MKLKIVSVTKEFKFAAAHFLTKYHGKCEHLHGHNYKLQVTVKGPIFDNGLVVDFGILKKIVKEQVLKQIDHRCLNDVMDNPTAENLAVWIWDKLENISDLLKKEQEDPNIPEEMKQWINAETKDIKKDVPHQGVQLYKIKIWETDSSYVSYKG